MKKGGKYQMHSTFIFCWRSGWTLCDGSSSLITSVHRTSTKLICMSLLKQVVSCLKKNKICTKISNKEKSNQTHWTLTLVCRFDSRGECSGRLWCASYSNLILRDGRHGEKISRPLLKWGVSYSKRIKYLITKEM